MFEAFKLKDGKWIFKLRGKVLECEGKYSNEYDYISCSVWRKFLISVEIAIFAGAIKMIENFWK